jgi:hypothetical protein
LDKKYITLSITINYPICHWIAIVFYCDERGETTESNKNIPYLK